MLIDIVAGIVLGFILITIFETLNRLDEGKWPFGMLPKPYRFPATLSAGIAVLGLVYCLSQVFNFLNGPVPFSSATSICVVLAIYLIYR
jgi:hypothetical protein